jgi:small subunit ribosomal protein S20
LPERIPLANTPQAKKRARQNEKRRQLKAGQRAMTRTYVKKVQAALATGDLDSARAAYAAAVPVLDRIADKGVIHKNKAARYKSRLNAHIKALAAN